MNIYKQMYSIPQTVKTVFSLIPGSMSRFSLLFLLLLLVVVVFAESRKLNTSLSAMYVFGDSTVDSGNNNFIKTISRSNFPPYGKDFPDHIPTGRFTNGKLVTDFLASYAGIKDYIPPYLDPTLSLDELQTGVCFASAGTGFDPLTAQINVVIPIENQLKYFKECKSRIEGHIGKKKTRRLMSNALFLISAGTNDFMVNYYGALQIRRKAYNISDYHNFILQLAQQLIQGLMEMGARRIAWVGLPPIGCVPAVITLNSDNALTHRACIERLSAVARDYNHLLQIKLAALRKRNPSVTLVYVDIYKPIDVMVKKPHQFGFENVNVGCCGSGVIEFSVLCNPYSPICSDDSKYLFWDAVHPTQAAYTYVFQGLRPLIDSFIKCGAIRGRNIGSVRTGSSASISSVLIFGDSTADSGNNNFIRTPFKSNFSPYGRDFPNHTPTGRFSNGRLANDFLADYIGLKRNVPPYLDPTLTIDELITGVTFASAGSGFDPLTPTISNVIRMSSQLDYFKEYKGKLEAAIGKEKTKEVISNAVYFVSAGTNDFVVNYFSVPIRRRSYTVQSYTDFVISGARQFVQALFDEGARRIGVVGLPAMGCLPIVITLYSDSPILKRDCVSNFSSIARDYNQLLQKELNAMQLQVADSGARIVYFDAYSPLEEMALGHISGFDEVNSGCCGTGMVEASFLCNSRFTVCNDATKYVYFDSIHPTERTYELLFQSLRPAVDLLIGN